MLTTQSREDLRSELKERRKDKVYLDWTRRVISRLNKMIEGGEKDMNKQIRNLRARLKFLEDIYVQRIRAVATKTLATRYRCSARTVSHVDSGRDLGPSEYMMDKYKDKAPFIEGNNARAALRGTA